MKLCFDCANLIAPHEDICPHCGADIERGNWPKETHHLNPGTCLKNDRYIVGRAFSSYKYGIVYAALDAYTRERVAITEYYPEKLAARVPGRPKVVIRRGAGNDSSYIEGLQSFVARSEQLAGLGVTRTGEQILACFYENNTAYTVSAPLEERPGAGLKRSHTWVYWLLGGIIVLCALIAGLILTGVISFGGQDEPSQEEAAAALERVPSLIGLTEDEAREQYPDWELVFWGAEQSGEYPAGIIIRQLPEAGSEAAPDAAIGITISAGQPGEEGTMPYLRSMDANEARESLAGYAVAEKKQYDPSVMKGCVIGTEPDYGAPLTDGQEVVLTVSLGGLLEGIEFDRSQDDISLHTDSAPILLNYRLLPANVDPGSVKVDWLVGLGSVASVSDGILTPKGAGETTVAVLATMRSELTGETVSVTDSRRLIVSGTGAGATAFAAITAAPVSTPRQSTQRPAGPTPRPATPRPTAATQKPVQTAAPATNAPVYTPAPTEAPTQAPETPTPKPTLEMTPVQPSLPAGRPTQTPSPIVTQAPADY